MPTTDGDSLGPTLRWRLHRELDRVQPRFSPPRYRSAGPSLVRTWRFAPAALGVSLVSILALSAFLATGSANPVVWTQHVVTVIESNPTPSPEASPVQPKAAPQVGPVHVPQHQAPVTSQPPEHSETPEPRPSSEPSESPEPSDDHSGSGNSGPTEH